MAVVEQRDVTPALEQVPYQNLLRSIGAYLDDEGGSQMCVLETEEGFLVRYQVRHLPALVSSARFSMEDLTLWDRRRQRQRSRTSHSGKAPTRGPYEDLLRALGYELEHASARHMTLDELDGTYVLAYYTADEVGAVRKHRLVITPAETEQILRRARARRRAPEPGWLLHSAQVSSDPVRLVCVTDAEPAFPRTPTALLEYTIPELTTRSTAALLRSQSGAVSGVYRARRDSDAPTISPEERILKPFEAARLVTAVYARCLDPIRFPDANQEAIGKGQIMRAFARSLTTRKVLAALELVTLHIEDLRSLDAYQARLGTNAVRWMQYLAAETLEADAVGLSQEGSRLVAALSAIRASETVADRFATMRSPVPR